MASEDTLSQKGRAAVLRLADGTRLEGLSFGSDANVSGELVFNTGMVGYPEALTDKSYAGQLLVLTYPLVGNYGVPDMSVLDEFGLPTYFESEKIHVAGLIVNEYVDDHSHWNSKSSLGAWLASQGIPAIYNVDTRKLTKYIREHGSTLAAIEHVGTPPVPLVDPNLRNLIAEVSDPRIRIFNRGASPAITAIDCGMKYNIIRYLARKGVELTVVPYDFDFATATHKIDGLFISNGPGDPSMCMKTVETLQKFIAGHDKPAKEHLDEHKKLVPVFGICMGHQLLSLAAGAKTYKMKYGNRGMNQPAIDTRTNKCYITPQNHGYAVDASTLHPNWRQFFINANDHSNEGIIHTFLPFFSVQFHPEANGGPLDTDFLFEMFLQRVRGDPPTVTTIDPAAMLSRSRPPRKVLLLGSGGLSIGQAGEFDYSGSQAIKALQEEGVEVILINPNIATVQTSKGMADKVYFMPVTPDFVTEVIKKERPQGVLISMGGQTALNVGLALYRNGTLDAYDCRILGTPVEAIEKTEDRELFSRTLAEIGETVALSKSATNVEDAVAAAAEIGYPVLVRAAYALGGLGSGFAHNESELRALAIKAFAASDQILIDQDLRGWKEIEYEVVRDANNNCITVCNMENFDPLGVHTGDSIVIAPSQTLSNSEYYKLRAVAQKVVRHLGVVGECNIQYALCPTSEKYCIIEVNARLSRSSALASKATGYPLAYVAAKLAMGHDLVSLRNSVTRITTACFEPSLDYVVVKVPRWDLKKFGAMVDTKIGSAMKSVGEVMSIGRNFEEAIQKAIRMVNPALDGFRPPVECSEGTSLEGFTAELDHKLRVPSDTRLMDLAVALELGYSLERLHELTRIDRWFLSKLQLISQMSRQLKSRDLHSLTSREMQRLKQKGFGDLQMSRILGVAEDEVRKTRLALGVLPFVKQIDTLAAEYPAQTNYLYMTYNGAEDDVVPSKDGVIVLGGGPYCIGSSVEFDWCAVSCVRTLRQNNMKAIVINCNPETVSTDYDESDRLYFEELTLERVLDIYQRELAQGVVVSVGGQIPNNLSIPLHKRGVNILGTHPADIDCAEDRHKFSKLLDKLGVDQPPWRSLTSVADAKAFAAEVDYPVLVRPSYVLSGAAMRVVTSDEQLEESLREAAVVSKEHPVVISKFILDAKEIEFDGVAKDGKILNYAMSEHVENAGVHSGDATLVLPAQKLYVETIRQVKRISQAIAKALNISGPFNIQYISKENEVKVIECNLRASRTFPFISKTFDFNFVSLATRVMAGLPAKAGTFTLLDLDYVGIKAPQFSFARLQGADPTLGVEMMSTGEVACFGADMYEAFLLSMRASGFKQPSPGSAVLVSVSSRGKAQIVECCTRLQRLGFRLLATEGTQKYLAAAGLTDITAVAKPRAGVTPNAVSLIQDHKIELVINEPESGDKETVTDGFLIRRAAIDFGVSLITNVKCALLFSTAAGRVKTYHIKSMDEYHSSTDV